MFKNMYTGEAVGLCGLWTTTDNRRVENAIFFIRGRLDQDTHRLDACSIWEEADQNCVLQIKLPTADAFNFSEGGLYSDFLPSSKVDFEFRKLQQGSDPIILPTDSYSKAGIGEFSLRMICQLSRASTIKKGVILRYTLLLYPGSVSALTTNPGEQGPSWPGIRLANGEIPLGPRPSAKWGCPILPILRCATPLSVDPTAPSGPRLRRAIDNVMSRAGDHDGRSNGHRMREKWEKLRGKPEDKTKEPAITWPPPSAEPEITGTTT